jgi:hypothetical protein
MDELDALSAIGLGDVVQWVLMIGGVCAFLAPFLPPATKRSSRAYRSIRRAVDGLAGNFRNARNRIP